jgi:hypothetical protein
MRIQWSGGTDAQRAAMNTAIKNLAITSTAQHDKAAANSRLSYSDPVIHSSDTGFSPMEKFHDHIKSSP